jgi:hypothetical protein
MHDLVTVVMNTNGSTPMLIEEATYSVLKQTYKHIHFLIICTHPDGFRLDREYPNVEIINTEPFKGFAQQIVFALKHVKTPYWAIVDSDDYVTPTHIEDMMKNLNYLKETNPSLGSSFYIESAKSVLSINNKIVMNNRSLWWACIFTKLTEAQLRTLQEKADKMSGLPFFAGFDGHVLSTFPEQYKIQNNKVSYLYRRAISYQISDPYSKHRNIPDRLPVIVPQLYNDYQKQIEDFEQSLGMSDSTINYYDVMFFQTLLTHFKELKVIELGCGNSTVAIEAYGADVLSFTKDIDRKTYFEKRLDFGKICLWNDEKELPTCKILFVNDKHFENEVEHVILKSSPMCVVFKSGCVELEHIVRLPIFSNYVLFVQNEGATSYIIYVLKSEYNNMPINLMRRAKDGNIVRPKPSIKDMASDFARAMLKWAKSGCKLVSNEEYVRRRQICNECYGGWKCPKCGCQLWAYVALQTVNCEKWIKEHPKAIDKLNEEDNDQMLYFEDEQQAKHAFPSLFQQTKSFTGSAIKQIIAGHPKRTEDEMKRIQEICNDCEFFVQDKKRCKKCGCYMNVKQRWKTSHCKIGKW